MVCEKFLRSEKRVMSAAAFVDHARSMARFLEDREAHALGDRELARARIEQRYGIAGSVLYSLRYRPPKQIAADVYSRLCQAVEDSAGRQMKALEHEVAKAREGNSGLRQIEACKAAALVNEVKSDLAERVKS